MSAKRAAQALIDYDPYVGLQVETIRGMREDNAQERIEAIQSLLRDVMISYTLSLVAGASNTTEKNVVAALAQHEDLKFGTSGVPRSYVEGLYSDVGDS